MVIKVSGHNSIYSNAILNSVNQSVPIKPAFKSNEAPVASKQLSIPYNSDYNVKTPQKYTKLSTDKLKNGLEVYSYKLSNGYRVTVIPMEGSPAVAKTYVNVGSMNETPDIKGISHFLEHMAFNGTNGENGHIKLETGDSFKKIEDIGGWTNASTNYAITDYVNSAPLLKDSDLETQIRVLAAMAEDLKLSEEMITKEKGPVTSEINMILDNPQTIAMDQTVRTLFNIQSPADELVGGSVGHIQNLTRKNVLDYYNKYYTPDNTNIVVTGDVNPDEVIELVSKNFTSNKITQGKKYEEKLIPIQNTVRKDYISDKANSAEIMFGFTGPKNNDSREKLLYTVAVNYLSSNNSGLAKNLKEYNAHYSINSDKISTNPNSPRLNIIEIDSSEENSEKVLHALYSTINNLKPITDEDLSILKESMLDSRENMLEYSSSVNDAVGHAVLDGDLNYVTKYDDILSSITPDEVNNAISKYFDLNKAAITVIHPQNKTTVSFKGKTDRKPINPVNIETITLDNNFDLGFYTTKSNNFMSNISLNTDIPYDKKPAVRDVLNEIYGMGTVNKSEDELNDYLDKNNLSLSHYAGVNGIGVNVFSNSKNAHKALDIAKELLYSPRINEENLEKAKERIKDKLLRQEDTAFLLYENYRAQKLPYAYSVDEKLKALDSITLDDIKDFYKYTMLNSRGVIAANVPEQNSAEIKSKVIDFANSLNSVKENKVIIPDIYKRQEKPVVLTRAKNTNQADIKQTYLFKCDNSLKETATGCLLRSILSSSSIGLFDNLREKQNLAYSVFADISKENDMGELSLNILTTTDNKDTGEQSFDNLRKSIEGFNNQINELKLGKFTEQDLNNAKLAYKAMLLKNEGISSKVSSIDNGLNSKYGIEYDNKIYNEIDGITKEDIIAMAEKIFAENPVYSIVATQDTLDANKEFLNKLTV